MDYVIIKTKAAQKAAVVKGKNIQIQTPKTPRKAPVVGLVWPA